MPPVTTKDLRTWCRTKYGAEWWNTDDKASRLAEARAALGAPERAAKPNPLKTVYHWYKGDPDCYAPHDEDRFYKLKASACIKGDFVQASKNLKNHQRPHYWAFHWHGPCHNDPDFHDRHFVGSGFCEADDGPYHYGPSVADHGDDAEAVAQKLLALKNGFSTFTWNHAYEGDIETPIRSDQLVITRTVWMKLLPRTRERLLRDSFAETIYISEPA